MTVRSRSITVGRCESLFLWRSAIDAFPAICVRVELQDAFRDQQSIAFLAGHITLLGQITVGLYGLGTWVVT